MRLAPCRGLDIGHLEEGPTRVRPARRFDQRPPLSPRIVEVLVAGLGIGLEQAGITGIGRLRAGLLLLQHPDDLFFREP